MKSTIITRILLISCFICQLAWGGDSNCENVSENQPIDEMFKSSNAMNDRKNSQKIQDEAFFLAHRVADFSLPLTKEDEVVVKGISLKSMKEFSLIIENPKIEGFFKIDVARTLALMGARAKGELPSLRASLAKISCHPDENLGFSNGGSWLKLELERAISMIEQAQ